MHVLTEKVVEAVLISGLEICVVKEKDGGKDELGVWDLLIHTLYLKQIFNKELLYISQGTAKYSIIN